MPATNNISAMTQVKTEAVPQYEKADDNTLRVTMTPATPDAQTNTMNYDYLQLQKATIIQQWNDFAAARQTELDFVQGLLDQCDALDIVSKVQNNQIPTLGVAQPSPAQQLK
jgi:hypothetical protein